MKNSNKYSSPYDVGKNIFEYVKKCDLQDKISVKVENDSIKIELKTKICYKNVYLHFIDGHIMYVFGFHSITEKKYEQNDELIHELMKLPYIKEYLRFQSDF